MTPTPVIKSEFLWFGESAIFYWFGNSRDTNSRANPGAERIEEQVGVFPAPPIVDDAVEVQVTERIHEQTVPERIEDLIGEQFSVEDTTLNTVGTSSSSSTSTRCDELANMLDVCIQLLSLLTAQVESIEKKTAKRMLEPPLMEPPMMEPPMMDPERASAKRRRRTRYTPLPGIMENAV